MSWFKQLFSRRGLYDEISEEIQEHLEEKIEELVAAGVPRTEAAAAARRLRETGYDFDAVSRILDEVVAVIKTGASVGLVMRNSSGRFWSVSLVSLNSSSEPWIGLKPAGPSGFGSTSPCLRRAIGV